MQIGQRAFSGVEPADGERIDRSASGSVVHTGLIEVAGDEPAYPGQTALRSDLLELAIQPEEVEIANISGQKRMVRRLETLAEPHVFVGCTVAEGEQVLLLPVMQDLEIPSGVDLETDDLVQVVMTFAVLDWLEVA